MARPRGLLDKRCFTLRLENPPRADVSEDREVEVSDGDMPAVDGASLSSLPGSARAGVWGACGHRALLRAVSGAHPPPAAAASSGAHGRESNEGCHEASFLLLFWFFEANVNSSFPWFSPPARRPGPQPGRLSLGLSGVGPGVWTYQRSPGDSDCSRGQELLP